MQYSFLAVEQVIVMTVCIIASHHELILALQLKPSRKNLHFLKLAKTGSSWFYSGNRINQLQFFSSLCSKQNKTSCYSCKSTCETAPKSLSWALIYAPGFEYPPWLALSTCQSGWREIWNAFTIFICWVHWGPRIRISSTTLQMLLSKFSQICDAGYTFLLFPVLVMTIALSFGSLFCLY